MYTRKYFKMAVKCGFSFLGLPVLLKQCVLNTQGRGIKTFLAEMRH